METITWRKRVAGPQAHLRGSRRETLKVVNSFALLESSSNDVVLVLLVDTVCILELKHPLAGDELDTGRKMEEPLIFLVLFKGTLGL
jgi:hypothetical protein